MTRTAVDVAAPIPAGRTGQFRRAWRRIDLADVAVTAGLGMAIASIVVVLTGITLSVWSPSAGRPPIPLPTRDAPTEPIEVTKAP